LTAKLTPKQQAFVRAYLETGNACEAYRRAYDADRMKPGTVEKRAAELLRHGGIKGRLEVEQTKVAERHNITVDRIIGEYAAIAFADAGDFFDWGPKGVTVRDKSELTPLQRRVVAEASQTVTESGGTIRVKLHDKLTALERLGKHLGMFPEKAETTHKLDNSAAFLKVVQFISDQARPRTIAVIGVAAEGNAHAQG
jgi:phage terminase small subunit